MRFVSIPRLLFCVFVMALAARPSQASNGSYAGSGGSFSTSTTVGQSILAQNVPLAGTTATISLQCPITAFGAGTYQWNWTCAAGSITVTSTNNSLTFTGTFLNGTMTYAGSGGGRGGRVHYYHNFSGTLSGAVTVNGVGQRAYGSIAFQVSSTSTTTGAITSLAFGWNSSWDPVVVAMGGWRLLKADNITGLSLASYGSFGSGTGQFESISGLAHDATSRIYISDSMLDRLVRIDNIGGSNWTQLGSKGTGAMHFQSPAGVAIDKTGKIWVADAGNNRIVRFDDMNGTNWTSYGSLGSGAGQFNAPSAIAFDSQGRIYVADKGNGRLVRFDNLSGTNWTTLSTISVSPYAYSLAGINGVAIVAGGKIVVSTSGGWLFRVDNMAGTNPHYSSWSPSLAGMSVDPSGSILLVGGFAPGLAETADASGTGWFTGTLNQASIQASAVLAMATTPVPPPAPVVSKSSMAFGSQKVGTTGPVQTLTLTNIGAAPMNISSIGGSPEFKLNDHCGTVLAGGASCTIDIRFAPAATGLRTAALIISTASWHPTMRVSLSGTGI